MQVVTHLDRMMSFQIDGNYLSTQYAENVSENGLKRKGKPVGPQSFNDPETCVTYPFCYTSQICLHKQTKMQRPDLERCQKYSSWPGCSKCSKQYAPVSVLLFGCARHFMLIERCLPHNIPHSSSCRAIFPSEHTLTDSICINRHRKLEAKASARQPLHDPVQSKIFPCISTQT